MLEDRFYRLWADVDIDAIRSNINKLKKEIKENVRTCAVIKADGYGHGAVQIAQSIYDLVDFYAVATLDEALELRNSEIEKPVLILGHTFSGLNELAVENNVRLTVYDYEMAKDISISAVKINKNAKIHIALDTGMSRIGFDTSDESVEIVKKIAKLPGIEIEGMFTHFANADDETEDATLKQLALFNVFTEKLEKNGIYIPVKHCSNSAATTNFKKANCDMVRIGVSMYGMYPSKFVHKIKLTPALTLKSHIIMVKDIEAGTPVGYGSTWTAEKKSTIATIPVGYADGYMRSLSNKGYVLIHGVKCPIVGRICMDCLMVDVTGNKYAKKGEEVVLIGKSCRERITMEEISELAGSFNYEFACDLGKRIPRRYFSEKKEIGVKDYFEKMK